LSSTETIETTSGSTASPSGTDEHGHAGGDPEEQHHATPTLNPDCTREVEIEVSTDEVARSFQSITKRYQKMARIPGFRSGKVPESLVRGRFAQQIRQDVVEALIPGHFRTAIAERNLQPVSQPQVTNLDLEEGKPLHFKALFEVVPEFSIEGYEQVKVEKPELGLIEAEFEAELDRIRDSRSTMEPVLEDRPLADGDFAEISFTGKVQGVESSQSTAEGSESMSEGSEPTAEGSGESQPITGNDVLIEVGGKNTIDSFNAALRGAKPGQQLEFQVNYPEDFGERRLAGKTIAYDVEVKSIKKKIQPDLNDEFAKELGPYESFVEFSDKLREHLASDKRRRLENETKSRLVDALAARYNFPIPESLVQQQIDTRLDRGLRALAAQGMRTEDMRKLDFERLRAAQRDAASAEVKGSILLDRIADAENVPVPEQDVERELQAIALETQEPLDALRRRLIENGGLAKIREQLRRQAVGQLLYQRL
jgi:trigger factor